VLFQSTKHSFAQTQGVALGYDEIGLSGHGFAIYRFLEQAQLCKTQTDAISKPNGTSLFAEGDGRVL
jgi:hypothetical protein